MIALIIVYVIGVFFVGTCLFWVMKDSGEDVYLMDFVKYCVLTLLSWFAIVLIIIKKEPVGVQDIGFGILLGVPNYFSCRFLLKALNSVPAVIAFPTFSVSAVVIVTLAGLLVFKEKLSKKQWIALGIILVALIMLNI